MTYCYFARVEKKHIFDIIFGSSWLCFDSAPGSLVAGCATSFHAILSEKSDLALQGGCITQLEQFLAAHLLVIGAVGIGVACLQVRPPALPCLSRPGTRQNTANILRNIKPQPTQVQVTGGFKYLLAKKSAAMGQLLSTPQV